MKKTKKIPTSRNTPLLNQELTALRDNRRAVSSAYAETPEIRQRDPYENISSTLGIDWNRDPEDEHQVSIANLYRMMIEKIAGGNIDDADMRISNLRKQQEDLDKIEDYKNKILELQDIEYKINNSDADQQDLNQLIIRQGELTSEIYDLEEYFKGEGRQSDVVLDYLYDRGKLGGHTDAFGKSVAAHINPTEYENRINDKSSSIWSQAASALGMFADIGYEVIGRPIAYAVDRYFPYLGDSKKGDWRKDVIKSVPNDKSNPLWQYVEDTFAGRKNALNVDFDDILNRNNQLNEEIQNWVNRRAIDEDWKKNGTWHPLYIGTKGYRDFTLNISDPSKITQEDRDIQESSELNFWEPSSWRYVIPELGSSIGMMHYSLGSIAADALLMSSGSFLAKKLPSWLVKRSLISEGAATAMQSIPFTSAAAVTSLGIAAENVAHSREMETNMEAIQAMQDRVLQTAADNNADFAKVGEAIRSALHQMDPERDFSDMTAEDYVRSAIAFRIKTGDESFDKAVKDSEKGINQLINTNNALRVQDYIEILPFLNMSGSVISNTASKLYHGVADSAVRYGASKFTSKAASEIEKMAAPHIRAAYGRIIDKAAAKVVGDATSQIRNFAAIKGDRLLKNLGSNAVKLAGVGLTERYEEGVQELLQARYARGSYDDYDRSIDSFNIPELFNTVKLSKQALLDYYGLDPDDPENGSFRIKKAMNIGAMAGIVMAGQYGAARSALGSTYNTVFKQNPFDQTKSDWAYADMISHDYQNNQDTRHLQIYYDMLRRGRDGNSILKSLQTFKDIASTDNGLVDPDYVSRDARLAYTIAALYQDKSFNKAVQQALNTAENPNKGKPGSEEHREVLVQTAKTFIDVQDALELSVKSQAEYLDKINQRNNIVDELLSDRLSNERKSELEQQYPKLVSIIQKYSQQYSELLNQKKNDLQNTLPRSKEEFLSNPYVRLFIRSKNNSTMTEEEVEQNLNNLFTEFQYRNSPILQDLAQYVAERTSLQKVDFIKKQIRQLEQFHDSKRYLALERIFGDEGELLKVFRKVTGTDIDPNRALGIKDAIASFRQELKKIDPSVLAVFENANASDSMFDDQEELDEIFKNGALNGAVASTLGKILNVYKSKMSTANVSFSVGALSDAIFGKNGSVDEQLKGLIDRYNDINAWLENDSKSQPIGVTYKERAQQRLEKETERADVLHMTFDWLVNRSANLPEQRRLVAHKSFTDELTDEERDEFDRIVNPQPDNGSVDQDADENPVQSGVQAPSQSEGSPTPQPGLTPEPQPEPQPQVTVDESEQPTQPEPEPQPEPVIQQTEEVEPTPLEETQPQDEPEQQFYVDPADDQTGDGAPDVIQDRVIMEDDPDVPQPEIPEEAIVESNPEPVIESEPEPVIEDVDEPIIEDTNQYIADYTDIDYTKLTVTKMGNLYRFFYDGKEITLDESQKKIILNELRLLEESDSFQIISNFADGSEGLDIKRINTGSIISQTWFFDPNPSIDEETGEDVIVAPMVGGTPIQLKYKQGSGKELAASLSKKGFLHAETTNIYYVVGRPNRLTSIDKLVEGSDVRDALQVAMVIEDSNAKKSYVTYLRSLGNYVATDELGAKNEEAILRTWIRSKSADWSKIGSGIIPETHEARIATYNFEYNKLFDQKLRLQYKVDTGIDPDANDANNQLYKDWKDGKGLSESQRLNRSTTMDRVSLITQRELATYGASIVSNDDINQEILKLRELRNQIIAAYLGETIDLDAIPTEYNDSVKPQIVEQSNGKFNNQRSEKYIIMPKQFAIMSGSIDEISNAIKSGALQIGIGRGFFGNPQFGIFNPLNLDEIFRGKGLSGKLYQLLTGPATRNSVVPAMLIEQRFLMQSKRSGGDIVEVPIGSKENVHLCLDAMGQIDPNETEYLPSAAEAILHLLCNRVPGMRTTPEMVEFFLHNGDQTILDNQNTDGSALLNAFASKQIRYNPATDVLEIALPVNGTYELKKFDCKSLFESPEDKKAVVHAIATQMHWNTEKDFINQYIGIGQPDSLSVFITSLIRAFYDESKPEYNQRVNVLGCPQLSFETSDFLKDDNGTSVPKEKVSVLAWLIKEQRIFTDIDPQQQFKDPFVFATGVKQTQPTEDNENKPLKKGGVLEQRQLKNSIQDLANSISEQARTFLGIKRDGTVSNEKWLITSEQERNKFDSVQNATRRPLQDRFMLAPYGNVDDRSAEESFNRIEQYLSNKYSGEFLNKVKQSLQDKKSNIIDSLNNTQKLSQFNRGQAVVMVEVRKTGDVLVSYLPMSGTTSSNLRYYVNSGESSSEKKFTGVFSTRASNGRGVSFEKARKWLITHLNLQEDQVHLVTAFLRAMSNDSVFGVTNVSVDAITKQFIPYIGLSERGEYGIEYHEAFHFINLLVNNGKERSKIYDDFVKRNKFAENLTYAEIEELLADKFMQYMLGYDEQTSNSVSRLFRDISDFIAVHTFRRNSYHAVFRKIRKGGYAKTDLDKSSLREFNERYNRGVWYNKFHIQGATDEQIKENFPNIENAYDFYAAANAVTNALLTQYDFKTLSSLSELKMSMNDVYDIIDNLIDNCENTALQAQLDDLKNENNQGVLLNVISERLKDIGIKVKDLEKSSNSATEREKTNDNSWDRFQFEFSKKDNASNEVKLFLSAIPKQILLPDGQYIDEIDEYGAPVLIDYGEMFKKLLKVAWDCTSFDKITDGRYDTHSIMGIVSTWAEVDTAFHTLLTMLNSISDSNLKSQLYATVNSSLQNIEMLQLSNPEIDKYSKFDDDFDMAEPSDPSEVSMDDEDLINDRERIWRFLGDRNLRVARRLPSNWSSGLMMNGLTDADRTKISKQYIDGLKQLFYGNKQQNVIGFQTLATNLFNEFNNVNFDKSTLQRRYDEVVNALQKVLFKLAIPADNAVINVFLQIKANNSSALDDKIKALYRVATERTNGSIVEIVETITKNNVNTAKNTVKNAITPNVQYSLNELLNRRSETSDIGYIANAYDYVHPSSEELTVIDTKGNRLYPVSQNNGQTAKIRTLNTLGKQYTERARKYAYSRHSLLLDAADMVDPNDVSTQLKLTLFVGLKDGDNPSGHDFLGMTAKEDILSKMFLTERSVQGLGDDQLVDPTMADKTSWYTISSPNLHLLHSIYKLGLPKKVEESVITETFKQMYPNDAKAIEDKYEGHPFDLSFYMTKAAVDKYNELRDLYQTGALVIKEDVDAYNQFVDNLALENMKYDPYVVDSKGNLHFNIDDKAIEIFLNYLRDEIQALRDYYSKDHIASIVKNPSNSVDNYHGSVDENGRVQFDGNGGLMRYFYDVFKFEHQDPNNPEQRVILNLNQELQALWELQKQIESGKVKNTKNGGEKYVGTNNFKDPANLDGFELVREKLDEIHDKYLKSSLNIDNIRPLINDWLLRKVNDNLKQYTNSGSQLQLGFLDGQLYIPTQIPSQLLLPYLKQLTEYGVSDDKNAYVKSNSEKARSLAFISLITNFTMNQMISTIEVEKVITGDPAFFSYKKGSPVKVKMQYSGEVSSGEVDVDVDVITDMYSDKVKRLGSIMSPGEEGRIFYSPEEMSIDPQLNTPLYSVLDLEDVEIRSQYLQILTDRMGKQQLIDNIRHAIGKNVQDYIHQYASDKNVSEAEAVELISDDIYFDDHSYDYIYNNILTQEQRNDLDEIIKRKIKPYTNVTVTDAEVIVSPSLYRRIRIGLGQWTGLNDPQEGTDEWAYRIMEKDDSWMHDRELARKLRNFEIYPLKMVYTQNEPTSINGINTVLPVLNKMAMFPLFKFHRSTWSGRLLYDRMNDDKLGRIDMLAFKSAVKYGGKKNAYDPTKGVEDKSSQLNEEINLPSSNVVDYETGSAKPQSHDKMIATRIQSLEHLRMQLNTQSHKDIERDLGTQILKIAFSNILPNGNYTSADGKTVKGKELISEIMNYIHVMTDIGKQELEAQFKPNGTVDQDAVVALLRRVVKANNLGFYADEILDDGGTIQSMPSSQAFEQSVASKVYDNVIDIPTNGGSAIQQSEFGFIGGMHQYSKDSSIKSNDQYASYNEGNKLKWIKEDNSMEVMLSIKFFYDVLPTFYKNLDYWSQRQWLIDHDFINGKKSNRKYLGEDEIFDRNVDDFIVNLSDKLYTKIKADEKIKTLGDLYKASRSEKFNVSEKKQLQQIFDNLNIDKYDITDVVSNPKPFGIGYRIPTQGMSSAFAFTVADVLPSHVGDLIVVPEEFTSQTGSDFDVDKIYLATLAYKGTQLDLYSDENQTKNAAANSLLMTFINLLIDHKNFALARGSIDVLTSRIKVDFVKGVLRKSGNNYLEGGISTTPVFQAMRKMEFTTGKSGIAIFALAIANIPLTQATGMTMLYDASNVYQLGSLDAIQGQDGLYVSDWESAMVNAHVDVAKDAYIFDINVNQATYDHTTFLLRAGKGMGTFPYLAQPILKDYANILNNANGIYGRNVDIQDQSAVTESKKKSEYKHMLQRYAGYLEYVLNDPYVKFEGKDLEYLNFWLSYARLLAANYKQQKAYGKGVYTKLLKEFNSKFNSKAFGDPSEVFVEQNGIEHIKTLIDYVTFKNGKPVYDSKNALQIAKAFAWQLRCMKAFDDIRPYAENLAELVHLSQIDTKKFGNTIMQVFNYVHRINNYISSDKYWVTHDSVEYGPLEHYFKDTWLMDKLQTAYTAMLDILSEQLFSAQPIFQDIFSSVAKLMFGKTEVDANYFTDGYESYVPIQNSDDVILITRMLNSVLQFNSMFYNTLSDEEIVGLGDSVDLSFGGSIELLFDTMNKFLFGNSKYKNIFQRTNDLLKEIQQSDDFIYDDLKQNGEISNEFLNFIFPIPPTLRNKVGKIALKSQVSRLSEAKRKSLTNSIEQLLNHDSKKVRDWMHDMVLYSYYAFNNRNTYNSFFELIPTPYRKLFDYSVKQAILKMKDGDQNLSFLGINSTSDAQLDITDIMDVICRNNWFNDRLVPIKSQANKRSSFAFIKDTLPGDVFFPRVKNSSYDKLKYHRAIILTERKGNINPLYIKGGRGQLYRKAGVITINRGDTVKRSDIYLPTEKAGFGSNFQEMWARFGTPSMFEENALVKVLQEEATQKYVNDAIANSNPPEGTSVTVVWNIDPMSVKHVSQKAESADSGTTIVNLRKIAMRKNAYIAAKRSADIILSLSNVNENASDVESDAEFAQKTIVLNISDPQSAIQELVKMSQNIDNAAVHITTKMFDSQLVNSIQVSEDDVQKRFDKLYEEYLSKPGRKRVMTKEQFATVDDGKWVKIAKKNAATIKLYNMINSVLQNVQSLGGLSSYMADGKEIPTKIISIINNNIVKNFGESSFEGTMYISKTYAGSVKYKQRALIMSKDINRMSESFTANEEAETMFEMENIAQQQKQNAQLPSTNEDRIVQEYNGEWTRTKVEHDPTTLYIFTDNTDRDSGSRKIDPNSRYAQKYGKDKHHPTETQAVIRGLDNAMPISTQRWYHEGAKGDAGMWTDDAFEEFKSTIDAEVEDIINEWNTGKYKHVMFGSIDGLFGSRISKITEARVPRIYQYLKSKIDQLVSTLNSSNAQSDPTIVNESNNSREHENC